jgi:hypothetical protein
LSLKWVLTHAKKSVLKNSFRKEGRLELFLNPSSTPDLPFAPERPARKSTVRERGPQLPENLPVVEEVIDPQPVKEAPETWRCIGQEVSEQLDYEPARFLRRRPKVSMPKSV